jgi:hypothetical protein
MGACFMEQRLVPLVMLHGSITNAIKAHEAAISEYSSHLLL